MVRSPFCCQHAHHHEHHRHQRQKHHSHHDLTLANSINVGVEWGDICHSEDETDFKTSQSETETNASDTTDTTNTTTDHSCLSPTTSSINVNLRHEVYPLHVSVNLRIGGTNTALLPEDVFIPTAGSETLESIFEAAVVRYPHHVGRYILRKEKDVIVLCHDEAKNTYSKTSVVFAALSKLRPIRLIFCVVPNVEVIRKLDSQKVYTMKVNARTESGSECILEKDMMVEAQGSVSAKHLWVNLSRSHPEIRGLIPTGLLTRRPSDSVVVRFGMHDFVADIVKSRGRRFIFILGGHVLEQKQRRHTENESSKHSRHHSHHHHHHHHRDSMVRYKLWFGLRPFLCGRGGRMFQWGSVPKQTKPHAPRKHMGRTLGD